ncbi:MAG: hypothetical protein HYS13_23290 [Planctomycetia bacterium]|nr:hypothetical protein [Planctomycetia bacterium]
MNAFRVWERSLGNASRVRVEGEQNARWLLARLAQSFVFKGSDPVCEAAGANFCTFRVPYSSALSRSSLAKLLAGIPEVHLMREPA